MFGVGQMFWVEMLSKMKMNDGIVFNQCSHLIYRVKTKAGKNCKQSKTLVIACIQIISKTRCVESVIILCFACLNCYLNTHPIRISQSEVEQMW